MFGSSSQFASTNGQEVDTNPFLRFTFISTREFPDDVEQASKETNKEYT